MQEEKVDINHHMDIFGDMLKSYEYFTKDGIARTPFFPWDSDLRDKWQLKGKLRNFYKDE